MTLGTYTHVLEGADKRIAGKLDAMLGNGEPEPEHFSRETMRQVGRVHYGKGKKRAT